MIDSTAVVKKEFKPTWLKVDDVARHFNVERQVIWKACKRGELPYKKVGRAFFIPRTAIDPSTAEFDNSQK